MRWGKRKEGVDDISGARRGGEGGVVSREISGLIVGGGGAGGLRGMRRMRGSLLKVYDSVRSLTTFGQHSVL